MTEGARTRLGFSAIGGRKAKAEKIAAILAAAGRPLNPTDDVLDLGCGSGEIAEHLSASCRIVCADARDQRTQGLALPFHLASEMLPFADASFDVVISNHVIEHTADQTLHIIEISRVLKPGGVAYLATPNRLWPWEVHARLPLLHYLPWRLFSRIGIMLGRLHEPVRLLSLHQLHRSTRGQFRAETWHDKILHESQRFALRFPPWLHSLFKSIPTPILGFTSALQPTLIVLLWPK